jgi:hypothetical protein
VKFKWQILAESLDNLIQYCHIDKFLIYRIQNSDGDTKRHSKR